MSRITLTEVGAATKQGKFYFVPIAYDDKGKPFKKKIMDFANKELYNLMKESKVGDQFDVEIEKDDNGYWQWKTAVKVTAASAAVGVNPASAAKGNWETSEERAAKQVYIARQSSLAQAIAFVGVGENNVENVLEIAEQFADWVMRPTNTEAQVDG